MSAQKWTPGPWRLGPDAAGDALTVWSATPGICITCVFDDRMGADTPPMPEALANAALVAAAPELYAALVAAEEELRLIRLKDTAAVYNPVLRTQMTLALAKARGEP